MPDFSGVTEFATEWSVAIGQACWQGGLALLVALLISRLPRLSPRIQCWIWRLAYLKLLLTLFWTRPVNLPILPAPATTPLLVTGVDWSQVPVSLKPTLLSTPTPAASNVLPALCGLWAAGVMWRFV